MKWKWPLAALAVAALCLAAYVGGALPHVMAMLDGVGPRKAAEARQSPPPAVSVARATQARFVETVTASGTLLARNEILVAPEIEGLRVKQLLADVTDRVAKGDVLARLERGQLEAQLAQNAAALSRSDAAIAQARSQIVEYEAKLAEASSALERAKPLRQSGYLAESVFDQRDAAAKTAGAQLVAARGGLKVAEAEKVQAEAQRRELEWKLSNTEVRAPADGIVTRRNARVGALAASIADPLFHIAEKGEIELDAEVPEAYLPKISIGQSAKVAIAGLDTVEGKVRLISPEVDRTTRLGRVRIFLGNSPSLRIGAFGRASIETGSSRGLSIPVSALVYADDTATVQLVVDDRVATRAVKIGLVSNGRAEIVSGLNENDAVVARAGSFLRDGDVVRPVEPDESTLSEAGANATLASETK